MRKAVSRSVLQARNSFLKESKKTCFIINKLQHCASSSSSYSRWQTSSKEEQIFDQTETLTSTSTATPTPFIMTTINEGERAIVWDASGKAKHVTGPQRFIALGSKILKLKQHTADPSQFIRIQFKDGNKEYVYGPANIWEDPLIHENIAVFNSLSINSNEAIVVYREDKGTVSRRIVHGPKLHMPLANEWIHRFSWHGADPLNPDRKKACQLNFSKLRLIPSQLYYSVENVRTSDDALLTLKLMVFYDITDLEKMLDKTHDTIADIINGASADVIDFTAARNFEKFKLDIDKLNDLSTYSQLQERAKMIGISVSKVIFRGYVSSSVLQEMHNEAIEKRTKLRLEEETQQQAQKLQDYNLLKEKERSQQKMELQQAEAMHKAKLERIQAEDKILKYQMQEKATLEVKQQEKQIELDYQQTLRSQEVAHLEKLKELGVDLTTYLVSKNQGPSQWIRLESTGESQSTKDKQTHLHLHSEARER